MILLERPSLTWRIVSLADLMPDVAYLKPSQGEQHIVTATYCELQQEDGIYFITECLRS